jgi:RHS repeat-associated protein
MGLKVSRCLPFFVLLLVLFESQRSVNAQSVPCAAITRNPLVLEALLDSHSDDSEPDLHDGTISAAQLGRLQFRPIFIQPGDALYVEYRGRDFTVNADFTSGDRTAFDSSPKGSYDQWRKGILPLDMFRAALNQRLVRLWATAKSPDQVFFRKVKIIRAGKPVFEFANLASYGKPQAKTAVQHQLPCVGFDEASGSGSATTASYSLPNAGLFRNFSSGLAQPMLPPFPMMMQSTTPGADANHYKFTGKELDDETGLYNYGARYYGPSLGRFITPDWSAVPVPVPYADLEDPQTLNQYSYVRNIPTVKVDPDGHDTNGLDHEVKGFDQRMDQVDAFVVRALNHPAVQAYLEMLPFVKFGGAAEGAAAGAARGVEGGAAKGTAEAGVTANAAKGAAFEKTVVNATKEADTKVAEQVTLKTESGVKTKMDVVSTKSSGDVRLQEAKGSATAPLTKNQKLAHPEIGKSGATVVGKGKPDYPGGTKIPPTKVEVVRPKKQD